MKILHISDIHFQDKNWGQFQIIKSFFEDLENYVLKKDQMELIFITGDLTQSGDPNEFDKLKEFLDKLLEITNLDKSKLLLIPGNHDINRKSMPALIRQGILNIENEELSNKVIDEMIKNSQSIGGLQNYYNFYKEYFGHDGKLFENKIFTFKDVKVGISLLNSAWSSWGGVDDLGNVILGHKQLEKSSFDIESCNFKIGLIHHPLNWFKEFDKKHNNFIVNNRYDFFFFGHEHEGDFFSNENKTNKCIHLKSPCLYESTQYANGYSVVTIDFETKKCRAEYRSYFSKRRSFDVGVDIVQDGFSELDFSKKNEIANFNKEHFSVLAKLQKSLAPVLTKSILTTFQKPDLTFKKLFIRPTLSTLPETTDSLGKIGNQLSDKKFNESKNYSVEDVITGDDNFLIAGAKESGKTTLLNFIVSEILEGDGKYNSIPMYIDYVSDLKKGESMYEKAIEKFVKNHNLSKEVNLPKDLKNGRLILLIDNFDFKFPKKNRDLGIFAKKYPNVRLILTTNESVIDSLGVTDTNIFPHTRIYIHSFKRQHTRSLVRRVCDTVDAHEEEKIVSRVMDSLTSCFIPHSPFMISVALSVYQHETNFKPLNKASLVEKFIEILLGKLTLFEDKSGLDYRAKEHYLSFVTEYMVNQNCFAVEINKFELETISYLQSTGSPAKGINVINYFIERNIFKLQDGLISFKLKCFFEYFLAKKMMDESETYKRIVEGGNFLIFSSELEYYADLKRNCTDLLDYLEVKLREYYNNLNITIDLTAFEKFKTEFSPISSDERKEIITSIESSKNDVESRDTLLDVEKSPDDTDQIITKTNANNDLKLDFVETLFLYGNVLKSCDLIRNKDYKREKTYFFVDMLCNLMMAIMIVGPEEVSKLLASHIGTDTEVEPDRMFKILVPLIGLSMSSEVFASPNYSMTYQELADDKNNSLLSRLVFSSLNSNISPNKFLDDIKLFIYKIEDDSNVVDILFFIVMLKYMSAKFPANLDEKALDLISEIALKKAGSVGGHAQVGKFKDVLKTKLKLQKVQSRIV